MTKQMNQSITGKWIKKCSTMEVNRTPTSFWSLDKSLNWHKRYCPSETWRLPRWRSRSSSRPTISATKSASSTWTNAWSFNSWWSRMAGLRSGRSFVGSKSRKPRLSRTAATFSASRAGLPRWGRLRSYLTRAVRRPKKDTLSRTCSSTRDTASLLISPKPLSKRATRTWMRHTSAASTSPYPTSRTMMRHFPNYSTRSGTSRRSSKG